MTFIKGESGNPMGRPKGSLNRNTARLRELISGFLNSNFETISADFKANFNEFKMIFCVGQIYDSKSALCHQKP